MNKRYILSIFCLMLLLSCNDIEVAGTQQDVVTDFRIQVTYEDEFQGASVEGITLFVTDPFQEQFTLETNENGVAVLEGALVGNYSITTSHQLSPDAVFELTGNSITNPLSFNGSVSSFALSPEQNEASIELISANNIGSIVISELYYSGSDRDAGSSRDQYIELYNNSNQVVFIDRWYLGLAERRLRDDVDERSDDEMVYTLSDGQYDWTTSLDLSAVSTEGDLNADYIYARELYQFPGDGDDYPIQPGEAIVIAKTALNHKKKVGTNEDVPLPNLTIDLTDADFEVYYDSRFDADPVNTPNMTIIQERRPGGNDLILDLFGRNGVFLLKNTANVVAYGEALRPDRDADNIGETRWYYMQIPISEVVDGVQGNRFDVDSRVPLVFPNSIDAGFVTNPGGLFSSEAVQRKITPNSEDNERKVLEDTNNSTNDFVVQFPTPGEL